MRPLARTFWYLLKLGLLIGLVVWLAGQSGETRLSIFGYIIEMPSGLLMALIILVIALAIAANQLMGRLWQWPERWQRNRERKRWLRGKDAILGGLIALNMGDRKAAKKYLSRIERTLTDDPLLHLLKAQAAWRSGEWIEAKKSLQILEKHQSTAALGKVGLFHLHVEKGEKEQAWQIGQSLLNETAIPADALNALHRLAMERQDWNLARHTLEAMGLDKKTLQDKMALLFAEKARCALIKSDFQEALDNANEALKNQNEFLAARLIKLRALLALGKEKRAQKALREFWRDHPHDALIPFYCLAHGNNDPITCAQEIPDFIKDHPGNPSSQRLAAEIYKSAALWGEANRYLGLLAANEEERNSLSHSTCLLGAEIEEAMGNGEEVSKWLKKMEYAHPEKRWTCHICTHHPEDWVYFCPTCHTAESIQWRHASPKKVSIARSEQPLLRRSSILS